MRLSRERRATTAVFILLSIARAATAGDALSSASIALRCEGGRVLIVGDAVDDNALEKLATGGLSPVQLNAALSPAEIFFEITPKILRMLAPKRGEGFEIGALWQVYPGAGPPATVVVEKVLLLYHGDGNRYVGALGRFLNPNVADRIAGLRAAQYLAVPGAVVRGISERPMMPLVSGSSEVTKLLFDRGREVVHDDNWQMGNTTDAEEIKRIREMNRIFLARDESQTSEIRMWRWAPREGKPLLFVEAVWIDDDRHLPLFAVDAVIQEREVPTILSFNSRKGEWMRGSEFSDRDWRLRTGDDAFLNAWKVGNESYVLTYIGGYEGYSVELRRIDSEKGLVTVLGFGQ